MKRETAVRAGITALTVVLAMVAVALTGSGREKQTLGTGRNEYFSFESTARLVVGITSGNAQTGSYNVGSGVVATKKGHIFTSYTALGNDTDNITVTLYDGRKISGVRVWENEALDIAVIKTDCEFEEVFGFADTKALKPGDKLYMVGSVVGAQFQCCVSEGIVSGMYRTLSTEAGGADALAEDLIQTDITSSGSRGSAVINEHGELVGIAVLYGESFYAVPANILSPVAKRLEAGENVSDKGLGMYCYDAPMQRYLRQSFDENDGVMVAYLSDGGVAEKSGIMLGDIIMSADGRRISTMLELYEAVNAKSAGEETVFEIKREEKILKIKIIAV